ncbi:hypothetical protein GOV10_04995, partial [Candidatus Woesearchaeota archaeon]|nr:hypothetical protein [Candidatus Woesearchaeota archaeon]
VGTVHSHPSSSTRWSRADLRLFNKFGWVHAIIGRPYKAENMVFYDKNGNGFSWALFKMILLKRNLSKEFAPCESFSRL